MPTPQPTRPCLPSLVATLLALSCSSRTVAPVPQLDCDGVVADWPQWALSGAHQGTTCALGQPLERVLARLAIDDNIADEKRETDGEVLVHYQQPLVVGGDVYVPHKAGTYVACDPPGSGEAGCGPQAWDQQTWSERKLHWEGAQLVADWEFVSDWIPPPDGPQLSGWEPVFHAGVAGDVLYVPGRGGTLHLLDRHSGAPLRTIDPLAGAGLSASAFLTGPLALDARGAALYSVLVLDPVDPWGRGAGDAQGFFVRAQPSGATEVVSYAQLLPQAPVGDDLCEVGFGGEVARPLPPPDVDGQPVVAPRVRCGSQRAPVNFGPAIGPDGAIFLASRAHRVDRAAWVLALNPDLTPRWATSLRGLFDDGCGALVPFGTTDTSCRAGARLGVDPATNAPPGGRLLDDSTATPVVLPDGSVLLGTYTAYNGSRGHLVKLSAAGRPVASYDFGWDLTPAVFPHDGTASIVVKDNHYTDGGGPYGITQLDAQLRPEWSFVSTNTSSCGRNADGSLACVADHPNGFEWCVNSVAVDRAGVVYANSEDGSLYAINPGGTLRQRLFLNLAIGAAYTPLSLDAAGRVYTQNDGLLFVVGE